MNVSNSQSARVVSRFVALLIPLVDVLATSAYAAESVSQGLAASLVASAEEHIEQGSKDAQLSGLMLLSVLGDVQGEERDMIWHAMEHVRSTEDRNLLGKLDALTEDASSRKVRRMSMSVLDRLERNLGWCDMESAVPLNPCAEGSEASFASHSLSNGYAWFSVDLESDMEYTLESVCSAGLRILFAWPEAKWKTTRSVLVEGQDSRAVVPSLVGEGRLVFRLTRRHDEVTGSGAQEDAVRLRISSRRRPDALPFCPSLEAKREVPSPSFGIQYATEFSDAPTQWVRVVSRRGCRYTFATSRLSGGSDPKLALYRVEGDELLRLTEDDDGGEGLAASIDWVCGYDGGDYFVLLSDVSEGDGACDIILNCTNLDLNLNYAVKMASDSKESPGISMIASGLWPLVPPSDAEGGWVRFSTNPGRIYRLQTNANLDAHSGGRGVALIEGVPGLLSPEHAMPLELVPSYLLADSRECFLRVTRSPEGDCLLRITEVTDAEEEPYRLPMTPLRNSPPRIDPTPFGYLVTVRPRTSVAAWFPALEDDQCRFVVEELNAKGSIRPSLLSEMPTGEFVDLRDSERWDAEMATTWVCPYGGNYYLQLENPSAAAARVFVTYSQERPFDGRKVGDIVYLHRHEAVKGHRNWSPKMDEYVGKRATITRLLRKDSSGSYVVRVDVDGGQFAWRTRVLVPAE